MVTHSLASRLLRYPAKSTVVEELPSVVKAADGLCQWSFPAVVVPGACACRNDWGRACRAENVAAVVVVVDASERVRLPLLHELLAGALHGGSAPVLVLANKTDLEGALTPEALATELRLKSVLGGGGAADGVDGARPWAIYASDAHDPNRTEASLKWLLARAEEAGA